LQFLYLRLGLLEAVGKGVEEFFLQGIGGLPTVVFLAALFPAVAVLGQFLGQFLGRLFSQGKAGF